MIGYTSNIDSGIPLFERFSPTLPWYALYTRCHHEARVAQHLTLRNFSVLFPKYKTWSRRKDRRKIIELPLFPGYLFVQTEPLPQHFIEISKTPGLAYILGKKDAPEPVAQQEMNSLLILLSSPKILEPNPYFKQGEQVIVVSGPLRGAVGYVLEVNPDKRKLIISIELLGRSVAVHLSDEIVEKY